VVDGEVEAKRVAGAASSAILMAQRRHSRNRMAVGHTVRVPRTRFYSKTSLTTQQTHCSCQSKAPCSGPPKLLSPKPRGGPEVRHGSELGEAGAALQVQENQRSVLQRWPLTFGGTKDPAGRSGCQFRDGFRIHELAAWGPDASAGMAGSLDIHRDLKWWQQHPRSIAFRRRTVKTIVYESSDILGSLEGYQRSRDLRIS
jgi:hypothetical protein